MNCLHCTPLGSDSAVFPALTRGKLTTLQVNLGYQCNQSCAHCHVDAGPWRTEMMAIELLELIPEVLAARGFTCLDLTGGAPELHPGFRNLVRQVRAAGVDVIDRCNLTILNEPGHEDLASFLAEQGVCVTASLPCYTEATVNRQRGKGVFERSLSGLRQLNGLGYGQGDPARRLDLVYNPLGPALPPPQRDLENDYRQVLGSQGIRFDRLLTLANMPIKRFATQLALAGELDSYQDLLQQAHNPANLDAVMCREQLSVDWQGCLYDCDFKQQLALTCGDGGPRHLRDLLNTSNDISSVPIRTGRHCFACTAGAGSSCGGALQD